MCHCHVIIAAPEIVVQPLNQSHQLGGFVSFSVAANGSGPLSYQWKRVNSDLVDGDRISGAASPTLTISHLQASDHGPYRVVVSDANGATSSRQVRLSLGPRTVVAWGNNSLGQATVPAALTNAFIIQAQDEHSLALTADGTVVSWGHIYYGSSPVPAGLTNMVGIAPGEFHGMALAEDGTLYSWGYNDYGQRDAPPDLTNAVAIAAGYLHSVALRSDGTVSTWGRGDLGQTNVPAGLADVISVACGWDYTLALRNDGTVSVWGSNYSGQTNLPAGLTNVVAIASGNAHGLALRSNGTVVAWGYNKYGQTNVPAGLSNVVGIAAGLYHSTAILNDGSVVVWGKNRFGQSLSPPICLANVLSVADSGDHGVAMVGDRPACISVQPRSGTAFPGGTFSFQTTASGTAPLTFQWRLNGTNLPTATNAVLLLTNIVATQAGTYGVTVSNPLGTAVSTNANLVLVPIASWGLGGAAFANTVPASATNAIQISVGAGHSLALTAAKNIVSWGNTSDSGSTQIPATLTNPVVLAAGYFYSLAVQGNGSVVGWGGFPAIPPTATTVVAVAAGSAHCLALRSNNTVVGWGANADGQASIPAAATNILAVAAGERHSLVLRRNGTVHAWGNNSLKQTSPPAGLSNVVAIATGDNHCLALRNDGTVVAWGDNSGGQTNVPPTLPAAVAIAAGSTHSLALHADGTISAWGSNDFGQVNIPSGVARVIGIAAGGARSGALLGNGSPCLTVQPTGQSLVAGGSTILTAFATGDPAPAYQWQLNGVNITGATNAALLLPNLPVTAAGQYRCVITNSLGAVTSAVAVVTVARLPLRFSSSAESLRFSNGLFHFRLTGLSGLGPSVIMGSSNLVEWQPVISNAPAVGTLDFTNVLATNASRFYRAFEGP